MSNHDTPQSFFKSVAKDLAFQPDQGANDPDNEIKSFTVRLPAYQMLVVDALASAAAMTRQNFLAALIDSSIGQAAAGLAAGFNPESEPDQAAFSFVFEERFKSLPIKSQEYLIDATSAAVGLACIPFDVVLAQMGERS